MTEGSESRFAHLLQPIRDLAENWNIDIAGELGEYLSELEQITFSFDGVSKKLNFAEAALLIQGTTCVYSKKVEYLYKLLHQTLDFLLERKKKNQAQISSIGPDGVDNDIVVEEEPQVLCLDDIDEAEGIDLVEVEKTRETNSVSAQSQFTGRASLAHLVAFSSAQLGVVSSSAQSEEQSGVGDRRTDFRINTCTLHKSGALLLDDRDRLSIDDALNWTSNHLRNRMSYAPLDSLSSQSDHFPVNNNSNNNNNNDNGSGSGVVAPMGSQDIEEERRDSEAPSAIDSVFQNNNFGESDDEEINHESSTLPVEEDMTSSAPSEQRERSQRRREKTRLQAPVEEDEDEWMMMDPHEEGLSKSLKPFKKGKPFKLPKKDEKGNLYLSKKPTNQLNSSSTSSNSIFSQAFRGTDYPTNSLLKSAFFPEFEYLNQRVLKVRGNEKKKWQEDILAKTFGISSNRESIVESRRTTLGQSVLSMAEKSQVQRQSLMAIQLAIEGGDEGEDEVDNFQADFLHQQSDDEDFNNVQPIALDVPMTTNDEDTAMSHRLQQTSNQLTLEDMPIRSYEDLCRSHVEKYYASVEDYIKDSALSQRVSEWRKKLDPILYTQESRPSFDIHQYGESLIHHFNKVNETKPFADLVENQEPHDICRQFVAALQLANNGNLEVLTDGKLNSLQFKLVTLEKAVDIANYSIPSMDAEQPMEDSATGTNTKKKTKSKPKSKKNKDTSNKENEQTSNNVSVTN